MKRVPSYRNSIVKVDALLAKYASSAGLLDALHAMAILDDVEAPSLTELALDHLRSERGHARIRPPLALGELFDLRVARYATSQTRSISALQCARRFLCSRLGEDRAVETITEDEVAKALARFSDPQSFNSVFRRLRLAFNWAVQAGLVERSPLGRLAPRRIDWREPAHFLPDRVERIFRAAEAHPGPLAGAVGMQLALGFFAGVRTAEIARARWEDIDLDGALLRVPRPKGFTSGHKPRLVERNQRVAERDSGGECRACGQNQASSHRSSPYRNMITMPEGEGVPVGVTETVYAKPLEESTEATR